MVKYHSHQLRNVAVEGFRWLDENFAHHTARPVASYTREKLASGSTCEVLCRGCKNSEMSSAPSVPVPPVKKPSSTEKLQFFAKRYWIQIGIVSAVLAVVWCRRTSCSSPVCKTIPSFLKVCEQRPLPGGIPAGPSVIL